jgi:hypothetical protein
LAELYAKNVFTKEDVVAGTNAPTTFRKNPDIRLNL